MQVKKIEIDMEHGFVSNVYFFYAQIFHGCLVVLHQGHSNHLGTPGEGQILQRAVGGGCDVLLLAMPLHGANADSPIVMTETGPISFGRDHNLLQLINTADFSALKLFLDPILVSINEAHATRGEYRTISMVGISGGGWSTVLYSAVDDRISVSFPISGAVPIYLRALTSPRSFGDWEQYYPNFYRQFSYMDLFLLGTFKGRTQIQMFSSHDPCCFSGRIADLYSDIVSKRASAWGGHFDVIHDEQSESHTITNLHANSLFEVLSRVLSIDFPDFVSLCQSLRSSAFRLTNIRHHSDKASIVFLDHLVHIANSASHPNRSPLILCEDGRELGPAHSLHADVISRGRGRFSHYERYLLFSASDETVPGRNGRRYDIIVPGQ